MGSKLTVALFFGGRSSEHEVSVVSAKNIAAALNPDKYDVHLVAITKEGEWHKVPSMEKVPASITRSTLPAGSTAVTLTYLDNQSQLIEIEGGKRHVVDVAFPALHGSFGEDGTIQGLFRMMNLAFVGCDVLGSALSMDKDLIKRVLIQENIPTARYRLVRNGETADFKEISQELGTTLFVKPANAGSSVGVHKVRNQEELNSGIKDALLYDSKVLIEETISGRELEVAVLGHRDEPRASLVAEIHPNAEFYSYHAKYVDPDGARVSIPAELTDQQLEEIQTLAKRCYQLVDCEGLARVDFFYNESIGFYVNELNTLPGFTNISCFPKLWTLKDYTYGELVTQLIDLAIEYHGARNQLQTNFEQLGK